METPTVEQAVDYLRTEAINVQLELGLSVTGERLYMVRLLPWRNSSNSGSMIFVAEVDCYDALITAAIELANHRWIPLNWQVRMAERGVYAPAARWQAFASPQSRAEQPPDGQTQPNWYDKTPQPDKGR